MTSRIVRIVLMLGWIPTLALVLDTRWSAHAELAAQGRTPVKITRIYTGPDGKTKAEEFEVPLKAQSNHTDLAPAIPAKSLQFRRTSKDYFIDWHPAPTRQFVITLSGESEVELEGGKKLRLAPGHILLAEDTTGQGHISRAVGSGDRISLFVPLADNATVPR
jgi:quercetin dioxygenase-like cupin family protein